MPIRFMLLVSRQGKTRLAKWYRSYSKKDKNRSIAEITNMVLSRPKKMCNFIEWRDAKIVYKRYASLYFIACVEQSDNELIALQTIHQYVEILDSYFGNVCELDLIFEFHKAYYILDELVIDGEVQETNKRTVRRVCKAQDKIMEEEQERKKRETRIWNRTPGI
ncbi:MAG: AP-1 complex subunit sigma-2 [Cercozoa sp. M6MM]